MTVEPTVSSRTTVAVERRAGRLRYLVPITVFTALVIAFAGALNRDSRTIPSALIDKPVPEFALPPVKGRTLGLSSTDLVGEVSLVNVFASWWLPCR